MPVTLLATLYCYWLTIGHLWPPVTIDQKAGLAQEIGCCSSLIGWESNKAPPLHYDWLVKTIPPTHFSECTDNSPLQPHHQWSTGNSKKLEHYNTVSIQLLPVDSYTQCKTTWYKYTWFGRSIFPRSWTGKNNLYGFPNQIYLQAESNSSLLPMSSLIDQIMQIYIPK